MKKLLTLISITTIVATTACSNPGEGDNDVLSATVEAQTSVAETSATTFDEPNKPEKITVEAYLNGEKITIPVGGFPSYDSEEVEEYLHFAQRAVDLLVGLDNDFDAAIGEIKFGFSEHIENNGEWGMDYVLRRFNDNSNLISISDVSFLRFDSNFENLLYISIKTGFSNMDRATWTCIEFVKENGEWIINNLHDSTQGH